MKISLFVKNGDHLCDLNGIPPQIGQTIYVTNNVNLPPHKVKYKVVDVSFSSNIFFIPIKKINLPAGDATYRFAAAEEYIRKSLYGEPNLLETHPEEGKGFTYTTYEAQVILEQDTKR